MTQTTTKAPRPFQIIHADRIRTFTTLDAAEAAGRKAAAQGKGGTLRFQSASDPRATHGWVEVALASL